MTDQPPGSSPPPPRTIGELVAEERAIVPHDEGLRARVLSRAEEALRAGPPAPNAADAVPAGAGKVLATAAAGVVVVGGLVAALHFFQTRSTPSPPIAVPLPPAPTTASGAQPAPDGAATTAAAPIPEPEASAASTPSAPPAPSQRRASGVEELELLSRARKADAARNFADVLALVGEHERTFPGGRLVEEREILRIKALVGLGRSEPARRAAAKFHRDFPRSVLLHKVDAMVPSAP